jgi:hypothetical protein
LQNGGNLTTLVKELGFRLKDDKFRIEIASNAKYRILTDFFIALMKDDDAYFGWLY